MRSRTASRKAVFEIARIRFEKRLPSVIFLLSFDKAGRHITGPRNILSLTGVSLSYPNFFSIFAVFSLLRKTDLVQIPSDRVVGPEFGRCGRSRVSLGLI